VSHQKGPTGGVKNVVSKSIWHTCAVVVLGKFKTILLCNEGKQKNIITSCYTDIRLDHHTSMLYT